MSSPSSLLPPLSKTLTEAALNLAQVLNGHSLAKKERVGESISQGVQMAPATRHWLYETLRRYGWAQAQIRPYLHSYVSLQRSSSHKTFQNTSLLPDRRIEALLFIAVTLLASNRYHPALVVDESVKAARKLSKKMKNASGFVNAILQTKLRHQATLINTGCSKDDPPPMCPNASDPLLAPCLDEEIQYWHPIWWIRKMHQQYMMEHKSILAANNLIPPLILRVNQVYCTLDEMLQHLSAHNIVAKPITSLRIWNAKTGKAECHTLESAPQAIEGIAAIHLASPTPVSKIPGFNEGWLSVQDTAAQRVIYHLQLNQPGLRVLDACAAPGGKSGHIAESLTRLHQQHAITKPIALIALEKDPIRARRIIENRDRLGLSFTVQIGDLTNYTHWWDNQPFDRILVDVPCTASGTVRRHPDSKWLLRAGDAKRQAQPQQKLLDCAMRMLHPQGKLVYSTCSLFDAENREVIKAFSRLTSSSYYTYETILPSVLHDGHFFACLKKH